MLDPGMGACSNCGVVVQPGDRFCNACGTQIARSATPAAQPGYTPVRAPAPAPPAPLPYVAAVPQPPHVAPEAYVSAPQAPRSVARCQLGHEIVRGTSYCSLGHPIALDQMQFANELYGAELAASTYPAPAAAPQYAQGPVEPIQPAQHARPQGDEGLGRQNAAGQASASGSHFSPQPAPARAHYPAQPAQPLPAPAPSRPGPGMRPAPPRDAPPREAPPHVLRGFLIAYGRNPNGDFWPLTGGRHTIGRLGSSDGIEIPIQDPTVSSRHATLNVDPATGSIVVEDAGSTNGTFVNDEPIGRGGWRELRDGDRLRVGGFTTVVKVIGPI
jgi:hypothetical protein